MHVRGSVFLVMMSAGGSEVIDPGNEIITAVRKIQGWRMQKKANQKVHIKQGVWRIAATLGIWLSLAIGVQGNVPAADDAYLKALEAEAENSAHVQEKKAAAAAQTKPKSLQEEFEDQLKAERPNTFNFYEKLSAEDKTAVLMTYKEARKLPPAARKVLDLYFK
jgi:hypothetical protein